MRIDKDSLDMSMHNLLGSAFSIFEKPGSGVINLSLDIGEVISPEDMIGKSKQEFLNDITISMYDKIMKLPCVVSVIKTYKEALQKEQDSVEKLSTENQRLKQYETYYNLHKQMINPQINEVNSVR